MHKMIIAVMASVVAQGASLVNAQESPMGILFAVGDIAECVGNANRPFKSGEAIANLIKSEVTKLTTDPKNPNVPIAVLALGDMAYDKGTTKGFVCFDKHWRSLRGLLYPVPGNHEYERKDKDGEADSSGTKHATPFFTYFTDEAGSGNRRFERTVKQNGNRAGYYFIDFPETATKPWRLIGLNSNTDLATQKTKLQEDLIATREAGVRCVLAFSHAFFYSSGRHGHGLNGLGDFNEKLKPEVTMAGIFQALYDGQASVMIAGHDHHFEQLGRAGPKAEDADKGESAQAANGIRSFVVGTGGTQLHSLPRRNHNGQVLPGNYYARRWAFQEAYNLDGYGVLKIELYDGFYKWQFVTEPSQPGTTVVVKATENRDDCNR